MLDVELIVVIRKLLLSFIPHPILSHPIVPQLFRMEMKPIKARVRVDGTRRIVMSVRPQQKRLSLVNGPRPVILSHEQRALMNDEQIEQSDWAAGGMNVSGLKPGLAGIDVMRQGRGRKVENGQVAHLGEREFGYLYFIVSDSLIQQRLELENRFKSFIFRFE